MDEAFYVIDGSGTFILNDVRHPIQKGGSIFIPKTAWHGFRESGWRVATALDSSAAGIGGLLSGIRDTAGVPPVQRTKEQINEIARKYATEFR